MESYNKYRESLDIDCKCNNVKSIPPQNNSCCGGVDMQSKDNTIEVLIKQLQREVKELMDTTQAKLLCQDKQIAECCTYIKNNLSNYIRDLIDSMEVSGELDEIIKSVINDTLIQMESDVTELKSDVTQIKSDILKDRQDIKELQNTKLDFEKYEDFEIDSKFKNIEISHEYYNDALIYITKIKNIDKLSVLPTNGDVTANINDNKKSIMNYAKANNNYDVYMNCGMNGAYIFDGIINELSRLDCPCYCGFDSNNEMKFYNGLAEEVNPYNLLSAGIKNLFPGFTPIIVNHKLYDLTEVTNLSDTNEIARKFRDGLDVKHPRQILAQDDENNFIIFSVMGRFNNCIGLSYYEMQAYFQNKNYKNVFNCDGGGSMQTVYNKNYIFYPSQELDTNIDREVPSTIGFKIKGVE